ncbi:MAG: hypothetical protein H6735_18060 [Alphaproteobacteria bacterium]|nr:hypothetical protein [Alphaproteobacteria bacterium]
MSTPGWIEEIARRYLADEASVFLVHGEVDEPKWEVDGQRVDAAKALVLFLRRSREVVAVLHPGPPPARLEFAEFTDRQKFENLVRAADMIHGKALAANEADPFQALGRIWRALTTVGTAQAYVVTDTQRLLPFAKKYVDSVLAAPDLFTWPTQPTIRQSNNLIVFLASSADAVRAELVEAACVIPTSIGAGSTPAPAPVVEDAALADAAEQEVDALGEEPAPDAPPIAPPAMPAADDAAPGDLRAEIERALVHALCELPEETRPALVPVMQAVHAVLAVHRPDKFGLAVFSVDEEGRAVVEGEGGDAFTDAWKGDIALSAAGGMVLKELKGGFSEARPPQLDGTGVGALVRRVRRIIERA